MPSRHDSNVNNAYLAIIRLATYLLSLQISERNSGRTSKPGNRMRLQIRSCCCALHTFVKVTAIVLTALYLVLGLVVFAAHSLIEANTARPAAASNPLEFDDLGGDLKASRSSAYVVVFVLVLVFSAVGVGVNVMLLLAIHLNRRTLMLPWLVFQMMVIVGMLICSPNFSEGSFSFSNRIVNSFFTSSRFWRSKPETIQTLFAPIRRRKAREKVLLIEVLEQ